MEKQWLGEFNVKTSFLAGCKGTGLQLLSAPRPRLLPHTGESGEVGELRGQSGLPSETLSQNKSKSGILPSQCNFNKSSRICFLNIRVGTLILSGL